MIRLSCLICYLFLLLVLAFLELMVRHLTFLGEELTIKELMDIRVILIRFMADKEAHKKIRSLERRAPKLWDKVDRMYKYKQKGNEDLCKGRRG